jgi:hypothetical protein
MPPATNPFKTQVGGSHYKQYAIQPYEFFFKNNIPHHKAAIIRRILRYDHETGKGIEDLEKIKHEVELIIELERQKEMQLNPMTSIDVEKATFKPKPLTDNQFKEPLNNASSNNPKQSINNGNSKSESTACTCPTCVKYGNINPIKSS